MFRAKLKKKNNENCSATKKKNQSLWCIQIRSFSLFYEAYSTMLKADKTEDSYILCTDEKTCTHAGKNELIL